MTAIKVPPLGESIVEATVSRWLKNEGDAVAPGETLVELETDKVTVEVPAMSSGVLKKRAHAEGDVVRVNDVLAEIDEAAVGARAEPASKTAGPANERAAPPPAPAPAPAAAAAPPAQPAPTPPPRQAAPAPQPAAAEVRASPAARRVAAEE
jgi:2-oxoglutarate dehydrogenase E2 component (dihydrolipoamide succinyltransferase)